MRITIFLCLVVVGSTFNAAAAWKAAAAKELPQAREDYDHARAVYRKIVAESFDDTK